MPKNDSGGASRQDWRTPRGFYDRLDARYGFTLDAAASAENALCQRYWTEADDALRQPWKGRVFCNPPYRGIRPWTAKAAAEYAAGNADLVVMLLPASTETQWYRDAVDSGARAVFIPRRLSFDDQPGSTATFGSALLIWGERVTLTARICYTCEGIFLARQGALTCSARCRTAMSRRQRPVGR